jgi:hypothetical protein
MNSDSNKPGRGLGIANTFIWGGLAALMAGGALVSATAAFNAVSRRGSLRDAALAAGIAVVTAAAAAVTGKVTKDSARDAFGEADEKKRDLPPFFAKLFAGEKGDSPNPPSRARPD